MLGIVGGGASVDVYVFKMPSLQCGYQDPLAVFIGYSSYPDTLLVALGPCLKGVMEMRVRSS